MENGNGLNYTVCIVLLVIIMPIMLIAKADGWFAISTIIIGMFAGLLLPDPYKEHLSKK